MLSTESGNMNHVRRRQFLLAAAGLLFAPIYAQAQKATKPYRVGVFAAGSLKTLQQSLNDLGYVEGRDIVFEIRNPEGRSELLRSLRVGSGPPEGRRYRRVQSKCRIECQASDHDHPHRHDAHSRSGSIGLRCEPRETGGNITGVTTLSADLSIKQLEILKEAVPRMSRVALLWNPDNPWHPATVKASPGSAVDHWGFSFRF